MARLYLMYLIWCRLRKEPFCLRDGRTIALMAATIAACACVQALVIAPAVVVFYRDVDVALFAMSVIGNGAAFPPGFAMPFMTMLQEELGFAPCAPRGVAAPGGMRGRRSLRVP